MELRVDRPRQCGWSPCSKPVVPEAYLWTLGSPETLFEVQEAKPSPHKQERGLPFPGVDGQQRAGQQSWVRIKAAAPTCEPATPACAATLTATIKRATFTYEYSRRNQTLPNGLNLGADDTALCSCVHLCRDPDAQGTHLLVLPSWPRYPTLKSTCGQIWTHSSWSVSHFRARPAEETRYTHSEEKN